MQISAGTQTLRVVHTLSLDEENSTLAGLNLLNRSFSWTISVDVSVRAHRLIFTCAAYTYLLLADEKKSTLTFLFGTL